MGSVHEITNVRVTSTIYSGKMLNTQSFNSRYVAEKNRMERIEKGKKVGKARVILGS